MQRSFCGGGRELVAFCILRVILHGARRHLAFVALGHGAIHTVAQERGQPCQHKAPSTCQRTDKAVRAPTHKFFGLSQVSAAENIFIYGIGAVSPAGWGVLPLREALAKGEPIPVKELTRPGWTRSLRVRPVPPPSSRPNFLAHARMRRTSPITQYAVAAAFEALGDEAAQVGSGSLRLGIILCVMTGCVNYSRRFYDETLTDPATASPLVFPETVFNAPASHLAAMLGTTAINYTLVGDPGTFLQGLALAADWLQEARVDGCLVIGAEEVDWLTADAYRLFARKIILSEGAGAVYVRRSDPLPRTATNAPVVLNEFMASNTSTLADPQGEFDDWIELHNPSDATVDLTGLYLTDQPANPRKWPFPAGTVIPAQGYLIVWADEDGLATEGLHANFKLSSSGESVFFCDTDANSNAVLDSVTFGGQTVDVSYGRPAASPTQFQTMSPTPGAVNY